MNDLEYVSIKQKREQFTIQIRKRKNREYFRKRRQMMHEKRLAENRAREEEQSTLKGKIKYSNSSNG